jgi:hypothetical protein
MSSEDKKADPACAPDDEECLDEDLERDLSDPHVPLDGAPPEHWKHVPPLTEEERLEIQAAKEEHQERLAHGRPRGKL